MSKPNPTTECSIGFPLVLIETPYAGDIERNMAFARACMRDCLMRGEAPYASHLLYTQPGILNDDEPAERSLGMRAGMAWGSLASKTVVYTDLGISGGMEYGIAKAIEAGRPVEYRTLTPVLNQTYLPPGPERRQASKSRRLERRKQRAAKARVRNLTYN